VTEQNKPPKGYDNPALRAEHAQLVEQIRAKDKRRNEERKARHPKPTTR
jgi:hypothetical protein